MAHLKKYLLAALLLLSGTVAAQSRIYLEPRLGYGTFSMNSMKELQQTLIRSTGVNAKATDTFGPYFQFGLNGVFELPGQVWIGALLEHGSTGGRVAYEDYSGELLLDTNVNYNALGLMFFRQNKLGESRFNYVAGIETSMFMSGLHVVANSRLYSETDSSDDYYNSFGFGLKPFVGLQYAELLMPLRLTVGYFAGASGAYHEPGEPDRYLVRNGNNDKLEPGWSGLRLNLSISIPLNRHN